ncbi:MAG: AMP-binding protein [Thermodesulfobacteriota bacterium]
MIEMADEEALRKLREERLRRTVDLCVVAHPFYRKRFRELGVGTGDIRTLDDLQRLPLVDKSDYMACPEDFRLRAADAPALSFEESTLWNVAYTTGTTSGMPSPFFNTTHDQYHIMLQARHCAEAEGVGRGDLIANLIPLPPMPMGAFLCVGRTAEIMGLPVVNALTGARSQEYPVRRGMDEAIEAMEAAAPTVFWGVPSFVRSFFRRARERNARFPGARMVILTGEPVSDLLHEELAGHLRAFGAADPQVRVRYSFTEMQGGLVQCCNGAAPQNLSPELYYLETVNPETGLRVPEGEEGAIALTHLHRRGTVCIRYLVGDLIGIRTEQCPHCGRLGERIVRRPRRTGTLVKVRGMLVNPELIFDLLSADRAITNYQLVIRKSDPADPDSMDQLLLRIEADSGSQERLAGHLPGLVQKTVMVRPEILFAGPGEIYDPMKSVKAKRLVDERSH